MKEASQEATRGIEDEWIAEHCFYCERLRCSMTPVFCEFLQSLYGEDEHIPFEVWAGAFSGRKKQLANKRRPAACATCPRRTRGTVQP